MSYDDLLTMERRLQDDGLTIRFAYDALVVEV